MTKHRGPARVAADFLLNLIACNLGPKLKTTPGSESLTQWSASARGPKQRRDDGQSMYALPGHFRRQSVPLLPGRHRLRCPDTGRCFQSWYDRAGVGRLSSCPSACRSGLPLFDAVSVSRRCGGLSRRWRSTQRAGGDITDLKRHNVAAAELTVDGEIEHSKVPNAPLDLKLRTNGPHVLGPEWRLRSDDLPLIPGDALRNHFGNT